MITPELKDKVLNNLLSHNDVTYTFNIIQLANELNCSSDTIRAILDYFNRLNLISATNYTIGGDVIISLNVEASDMALRGGFVAQEELIKKNFEKLLLELDSLKSKFPKNIETITSIIGNISNALQLTRWLDSSIFAIILSNCSKIELLPITDSSDIILSPSI